MEVACNLKRQGFTQGACRVTARGIEGSACTLTLRDNEGVLERLVKSAHLSRPEHYFSIYQSGCNMTCLKCHSWTFSQCAEGRWLSPDNILELARDYAGVVTCREPRERATSYHALDLCRGCGACVDMRFLKAPRSSRDGVYLEPTGIRSDFCPGILEPRQLLLSPQGPGPARNIIAFTGGDLLCRPEYYARCTEKIKNEGLDLWMLLETNGFGLTPANLDMLKGAGVDSFWLDIKAFDPGTHERLTGVSNERILRLPEEMVKRKFTLEVLTLFIPGRVEEEQISSIAGIISDIDPHIPFTILAFFPEYKMKDAISPNINQMVTAYELAKEHGLENVRLGNLGVFVRSSEDYRVLTERVKGGF